MLYNVGDIVQIKSKEWWDQQPKDFSGDVYCNDWICCFGNIMTKYCGEITKVEDIVHGFYVLEIDHDYWWIDEFFEDPGIIL